MKWRILAVSSLIALLLCFGILIFLWFAPIGSEFRRLNAPAIVVQVKQLKQLTTIKYSIQRVVGLTEQKVPLGEESLLLMVQGQVTAGVDLSGLTEKDILSKNGMVVVCLPPAQIFDTFLDEKQTKVWDHHITWWTPWVSYNPDLEHQARLSAIQEIRSAALAMGILDQSQQNAQTAIRQLLEAFRMKVGFETHQHS